MKKLKKFLKELKIMYGVQNTKNNGENFALTPYLFLIIAKGKMIQVYGLGIRWGYYSIDIGVGKPKSLLSRIIK